MAKKLEPEERLANYWRRKTGLQWSDFDIFAGKQPTDRTDFRRPRIDFEKETDWRHIKHEIGWIIMYGYPLTYEEYHVAQGIYYIIGEVPYMDFFKHHWYESAYKRGYHSPIIHRDKEKMKTCRASKNP
jgi:hypothetical protein